MSGLGLRRKPCQFCTFFLYSSFKGLSIIFLIYSSLFPNKGNKCSLHCLGSPEETLRKSPPRFLSTPASGRAAGPGPRVLLLELWAEPLLFASEALALNPLLFPSSLPSSPAPCLAQASSTPHLDSGLVSSLPHSGALRPALHTSRCPSELSRCIPTM